MVKQNNITFSMSRKCSMMCKESTDVYILTLEKKILPQASLRFPVVTNYGPRHNLWIDLNECFVVGPRYQ